MGPKMIFCLKGVSPNVNHILGLGNSGFYSIGGLFPNHLDSSFSFYSRLFVRSGGQYEAGFSFYEWKWEGVNGQ